MYQVQDRPHYLQNRIFYPACLPLFTAEHYIPSHTLYSSDSKLLYVPLIRSCFGSCSFAVATSTICNSRNCNWLLAEVFPLSFWCLHFSKFVWIWDILHIHATQTTLTLSSIRYIRHRTAVWGHVSIRTNGRKIPPSWECSAFCTSIWLCSAMMETVIIRTNGRILFSIIRTNDKRNYLSTACGSIFSLYAVVILKTCQIIVVTWKTRRAWQSPTWGRPALQVLSGKTIWVLEIPLAAMVAGEWPWKHYPRTSWRMELRQFTLNAHLW